MKDKVSELRGQPFKYQWLGKEITVRRMTMDQQIEAVEYFTKVGETKGDIRQAAESMIQIISIATGTDVKEIRDKEQLSQVADLFSKIWEQNEFDFLLDRVGKLGAKKAK
jgi:hypothetical protein